MARRSITTVRRPDPHVYQADPATHPAVPADRRPCRTCQLPPANSVHEVPDTHDADAEHRRRIGEDQ